MTDMTPDQAQTALDAVGRARTAVAQEVGLPRWYWWAMSAGWVVLGLIGDLGPTWLMTTATIAFGVAHSMIASQLLDGRRRTSRLKLSRATADRRVPLVVIGMLLALVALTVAAAVALDADGAGHPQLWAAVFVAAIIGCGGPEMLRVRRRRVEA